jgi:hypothetical protein
MSLEPNEIVARRRYVSASDPNRTIEVQIGKPIRSGDVEEYSCAVGMKSPENERVARIYGIDELQALLLALRFAKFELLSNNSDWRWADGEREDTGIDILARE